jgi:predicted MPP superfamily phosphohydrolase
MCLGILARFIIQNNKLSDIISWIGMLDMGLFSSLFVLTLLKQLIFFFYNSFIGFNYNLERTASLSVIVLALFATIIGFINARSLAKIVKISIPITNLPKELENFTIAQISDIHVGPTIKYKYVSKIVDRVNAINADMVAITGDLVDGSVEALSFHVQPISRLKSTYGSFFVLGNHEYYSGADAWITQIKKLDIVVLLNQHKVIKHNNANLVIAGITDYSGEHFGDKHKSDPKLALALAPPDAIKILLAHQPRSAIIAEKFGYDLQLSGHTHGGQFWPWNFFVKTQQPFNTGLHKVNNMWLYISRGTGYWGPPKRLGKSAEITQLCLVRA